MKQYYNKKIVELKKHFTDEEVKRIEKLVGTIENKIYTETGRACKEFPACIISIGNFSEFSYRIKILRGIRTARIRKMAAATAAHRLECVSRRTLFY